MKPRLPAVDMRGGNGTADVPISEIGQFLPWNPNPSTVWRWRRSGVNGVKLETTKIGGRVFVSKEQVDRFITACRSTKTESITVHLDKSLLELKAKALGL